MTDETRSRMSLAELLEETIRRVCLDSIRVSLPATVKKYHPPAAGQYGPLPAMVEVEIDLKTARRGFEGDAEEDETFNALPGSLTGEGELVGDYPTITCPVHFPGIDSMWTRGPLVEGEQGLCVFTDRSLGRWLVAGRENGETVDPKFSWSHGENLNDCYFQPGLMSGPLFAEVPAEGAKIGPRDGASGLLMDSSGLTMDTSAAMVLDAGGACDITAVGNVTLDGALVKLGAAASQVIALLPELKAPIATLVGVYANLAAVDYAIDGPLIKSAWAAFGTAVAALPGSAKGRG